MANWLEHRPGSLLELGGDRSFPGPPRQWQLWLPARIRALHQSTSYLEQPHQPSLILGTLFSSEAALVEATSELL